VPSIDSLFADFYAGPVERRPLSDDLRIHLLELWEGAHTQPRAVIIHAPASEHADTDEAAVRAAFRTDLRSYSGPYHRAARISHRERKSAWLGVVILLLSIGISEALLRLTSNVVVSGVAQGIVVIGWVALWAPAQRFAVDVIPHWLARKSYARLAELEVRFAWDRGSTIPAPAELPAPT
jgi:hypothetical protein